ncbi:hypothetical protein QVN60_08520 [Yersinia aleksiciae]|uniref:hypothetical protein n=1 Tax=Yersinia aleksiciae TaxID=263819 RepID=UPI0025AA878B|nr:hypothetical protein [Yersinia aleksiciae]MDN0123229.1 hypothetical protein [Yersinia aleksiciae]
MIKINVLSSTTHTQYENKNSHPKKDNENLQTEDRSSSTGSSESSHLSSLSQQLSDAALRAEERDSKMSRQALSAKSRALLSEITGMEYYNGRESYDQEVPDTQNPELLARAKQATAFTNGHENNPFKGMSREQLDLIAYDNSGLFTMNERRAAWQESYDQEESWRVMVVAQSKIEWDQGEFKQTNFFQSVLKHYEELPKIEQAQYPEDYVARLQYLIKMDYSFATGEAGNGQEQRQAVWDMMMINSTEGSQKLTSAWDTDLN